MKFRKIVVLWLPLGLLACGLGGLLQNTADPPPTPTFAVARFSTPTPTAPTPTLAPTDPPSIDPTEPPSPTAEATATAEPTLEPTDLVEETTLENPDETVSGEDSHPAEAQAADTPIVETTSNPTATPAPPTATPTETPTATPALLTGRIAFPIDDGAGHYDVWVFEPPDGEPFLVQRRARQPNFSSDGRLLINNQNSEFGENIGWLDANYVWQDLVSETPDDGFPFWQPDGNRFVYSNPRMLRDPSTGNRLPHVFMPCSIRRPSMEDDPKCRDIATFGKVTIGLYPVWTDDDRIAFFYFEGDDGLYVVTGASTLWQGGGVGQPQLLVKSNGRPSDTQGFQVFFSAGNLDQNWEAYAIDLDGTNLINLSNSPFSQDGLPTVSPDGNWVAFVSDRDGLWGIWVVPRTGGEPTKVLDLSKINTNPSPWGVDDRDWTFERITWGP